MTDDIVKRGLSLAGRVACLPGWREECEVLFALCGEVERLIERVRELESENSYLRGLVGGYQSQQTGAATGMLVVSDKRRKRGKQ